MTHPHIPMHVLRGSVGTLGEQIAHLQAAILPPQPCADVVKTRSMRQAYAARRCTKPPRPLTDGDFAAIRAKNGTDSRKCYLHSCADIANQLGITNTDVLNIRKGREMAHLRGDL